jgi:hypothetical protein
MLYRFHSLMIPARIRRAQALLLLGLLAVLLASTGCAAVTNPVADAIPARLVPAELLAPSREGVPLPLTLLRQPPQEYRLAGGDGLAVYVEGFLGERDRNQILPAVPFHVGALVQPREQKRFSASTGYPIPVDQNGVIDLPRAGPLSVQGMTLAEAREAIRALYVRQKLRKPDDTSPIIVQLLEPRRYSVLVLRQEATAFGTGPDGLIATSKRGLGFEVDLPAYENDVLHALARTGGLPGLDAYNEVVIYRGCFTDADGRAALAHQLWGTRGDKNPLAVLGLPGQAIHIPLRVPHGQAPACSLPTSSCTRET